MDAEDEKRLLTKSGVKGNVRYITITDNVPSHWEDLIYIAKTNYSWWAFIYHDRDFTDKIRGNNRSKSHTMSF